MTAPIPTSTVAIPTGYRPAFIVGGASSASLRHS